MGLHGEEGKEKRRRNMELLREKIKEDPRSLHTWLQMIENSIAQPEAADYVRQAMELVEEKAAGWNKVGAPIFRYAMQVAYARKLPELDTWAQRARELFPKSIFTHDVLCKGGIYPSHTTS